MYMEHVILCACTSCIYYVICIKLSDAIFWYWLWARGCSWVWVDQHLQETEHVLIIYVQDGMTAVYIASWKGHMEVVQLLLQQHADVKISKTVLVQHCIIFSILCTSSYPTPCRHSLHTDITMYLITYIPVTKCLPYTYHVLLNLYKRYRPMAMKHIPEHSYLLLFASRQMLKLHFLVNHTLK